MGQKLVRVEHSSCLHRLELSQKRESLKEIQGALTEGKQKGNRRGLDQNVLGFSGSSPHTETGGASFLSWLKPYRKGEREERFEEERFQREKGRGERKEREPGLFFFWERRSFSSDRLDHLHPSSHLSPLSVRPPRRTFSRVQSSAVNPPLRRKSSPRRRAMWFKATLVSSSL